MCEPGSVAATASHLEIRFFLPPQDHEYGLSYDLKWHDPSAKCGLMAGRLDQLALVRNAQPAGCVSHQFDRLQRLMHRKVAQRFPRPRPAPAEYLSANWQ